MGVFTSGPIGGAFWFFLQVISANAPSFPGVGFTLSSASGSGHSLLAGWGLNK